MCTESEFEVIPPNEAEVELRRLQMELLTNQDYKERCMKVMRALGEDPPELVRLNIDGVDFEPTAEEIAPCIRRRAIVLQHRITALEAEIVAKQTKLKESSND